MAMTKRWERLRAQHDPTFYAAYLRSYHGRRLRKQAVERARYCCMRCGRTDPHRDRKPGTRLQVHHLTYARLGEEHFEDLLVLCNDCHRLQHRRRFWAVIDGNAKTRGKRLGSGRIATDHLLKSRSHAK